MEAARILAQVPEAIPLGYLQTLAESAGDKSSTIVFPLPVDIGEVPRGGVRAPDPTVR